MKKFLPIVFFWIITIFLSIIWTYENPEKIEKVKNIFKKNEVVVIEKIETDSKLFISNSFNLLVSKEILLKNKTAFITHPLNEKFDPKKLNIYTQNGFKISNFTNQKLKLPDNFTLERNGGVKTIVSVKEKNIALISAVEKDCYYAALVDLETAKEIFKSKCLPEKPKNNDFNGLGSSNIHLDNQILISLGTPEKHASKNSPLAQDNNSKFGKILSIDKSDLLNINKSDNEQLALNIFSKGHRVPQGLTKLNNKLFSVEHGPKGGDELNILEKEGNYGWPEVSYGTNYMQSNGGDGTSYLIDHRAKGYKEPLFAFVPSVGISSLNNCPDVLKDYFKKPCLMALSLYGNNLRKGHSIIIFLLNERLNRVISIEKIRLENLVLRHFVTNSKNELYEDTNGDIFISADKEGIFRVKFTNFR